MTNHISDIQTREENELTKKRLDRIAWLLDSIIPLPGGFKVGLDALIGFIPVVGDTFTAILSVYIIAVGVQRGAPKSVIVKMMANIFLDALLGMVPVFGDIFDVINRANIKNVDLLRDYLDQPVEVKKSTTIWLVVTVLALLFLMAFCIWFSALFLSALFKFI